MRPVNRIWYPRHAAWQRRPAASPNISSVFPDSNGAKAFLLV
jgi:hypothetical protein